MLVVVVSISSSTLLFVGTSLLAAVLVLLEKKTKQQQKQQLPYERIYNAAFHHVFAMRKRYFSKCNSLSYENTGPLMILQVCKSM